MLVLQLSAGWCAPSLRELSNMVLHDGKQLCLSKRGEFCKHKRIAIKPVFGESSHLFMVVRPRYLPQLTVINLGWSAKQSVSQQRTGGVLGIHTSIFPIRMIIRSTSSPSLASLMPNQTGRSTRTNSRSDCIATSQRSANGSNSSKSNSSSRSSSKLSLRQV